MQQNRGSEVMKTKRAIPFILTIALVITLSFEVQAFTTVGLDNFENTNCYTDGMFTDVSPNAWYNSNIGSAFDFQLMNGIGDNKFNPEGSITLAETITIAARISYIYHCSVPFYIDSETEMTNWYEPYVEYAISEGIIKSVLSDYNARATRAQFAEILSKSIDPIDFNVINLVDDGVIPDVPMSADYAVAVYMLYRAGILTGSDTFGTFNPDSTITRAEAAAIITRIVDPTLRKVIVLIGEY